MMKKLLKVLLVSAMLCGLTGCYGVSERNGAPPPAPAVKKTIAVLPYGGQDAFWQQFHQGASQAAVAAGYHLQWQAPPPVWNPNTQDEMMRNITNLNPPGIILGPLHRNKMQASLVNTVGAGIPVVIAASNEDTSYKISYVGSDDSAMGADLAKWVGKLTPPNSKIAVMSIQEGMRAVDLRQHDLLQTLSHSFSSLQVAQVPFPEQEDLNFAESNLQKLLRSSLHQFLLNRPDVKAVVALDENSTTVAWQILNQLPQNNRPLLFGVSVDAELQKACFSGKIAALVVQNPHQIGAESVKVILGFKDGNRPPQQILIPYKIIHAGS